MRPTRKECIATAVLARTRLQGRGRIEATRVFWQEKLMPCTRHDACQRNPQRESTTAALSPSLGSTENERW